MKVYSITIEGMTSFFGTKRAANKFNSLHDEPEEVRTLHAADDAHVMARSAVEDAFEVDRKLVSVAEVAEEWRLNHVRV